MAILIDPPVWPAHGTLWSHLVSDADLDELHVFAKRLGVPRRGFDLDHYDVPQRLFDAAVALGARRVSAKEVVFALRASGLRVRQADRALAEPVSRRLFLSQHWHGLGKDLDLDASHTVAWRDLGEDLLLRWSEPHRFYHDQRHLEDVLLSLDLLEVHGLAVTPVTFLAAWFHDAVYLGESSGADERDSAALMVRQLQALGLDAALIERVERLILATDPAALISSPEADLAALLDADLAIFAASDYRYREYADAVRFEFAHVADVDFARARAEILQGFLARPRLFFTRVAHDLWESRARLNVSLELRMLRDSVFDDDIS